MENSRLELGDTLHASLDREKVLLDLLKKATGFYEDTIGILSSIFELSEYMRKGSPEDDFYSYLVSALIRESRCENASIFLVEGSRVVLKAAAGMQVADEPGRVFMELGEGAAGKCALEGKPVLISDTRDHVSFKEIPGTRVQIGSMLCVPIKDSDATIGVLNLSHSRENFFDVHFLRIFELLGLLAGQMLTLLHISSVFRTRSSDLNDLLQKKDESLRTLSESYKAVVDSSEDLIFILSGSESVEFCNQGLLTLLKGSPSTVDEILDPHTVDRIRKASAKAQPGRSQDFELGATIGGGSGRTCQFFVKRLGQDQTLVVMRDITAKRRMEQRAMQNEKLTSLGLLTSGIAHELNNRLTPILGFADLINTRELNDKNRKRLAIIINAANSAKHIVESLLKFSRNKPPEKIAFDMRDIIKRTVSLYLPTVKKRGIRLVYEEHPEPLCVRADMNCIEQVLVNFINNAIDAIGDKPGCIWLKTGLEDGQALLSIEDTGPGIPEEVICKVFDPFFTTKVKDKGTGLGLSICYGIISDHKGEISLENTGHGAVARMKIPAMTQESDIGHAEWRQEETSSLHAACCPDRKRSTIMVVEDEEDLLDLMVETLSPFYEVKPFNDGRKAFDHLDEHAWELIISDMRMPVMDGMELYNTVIRKRPALKKKFMFITGDTYDFQIKEFLESTGAAFLQKPFRIKELQDIVQKYVDFK